MWNPMETGTKTQTDLSSQSSKSSWRARHQSPNDTHPMYNDNNALQGSLGGHGLVSNKSLKTPGEGAMRMEKGSDICLHKKSSMAKSGMAYTRDLQNAFFFSTRKVV